MAQSSQQTSTSIQDLWNRTKFCFRMIYYQSSYANNDAIFVTQLNATKTRKKCWPLSCGTHQSVLSSCTYIFLVQDCEMLKFDVQRLIKLCMISDLVQRKQKQQEAFCSNTTTTILIQRGKQFTRINFKKLIEQLKFKIKENYKPTNIHRSNLKDPVCTGQKS